MSVPHVIPYQGSKRKIAEDILKHINYQISGRLFEPFAGSAAITLAAASKNIAKGYVIGDKYDPLVKLWRLIVESPEEVIFRYENLWTAQLNNPKDFFLQTRDEYNKDLDPVKLLYLITRCVKNAIRFNQKGEFNQSADNRRLGTNPKRVKNEINKTAEILKNRIDIRSGDFLEIIKDATSKDVIYMDPPWQGTSSNKNSRYAYLLDLNRLIDGLEHLNQRNIPFILSFDGTCGDKSYGEDLPASLGLKKIDIHAGRSSQATLLGRKDITVESLYLSPTLIRNN